MEQDLVEAREVLEKVATLMENAGWPGYAMEIANMANAVAALPYRGWRPPATLPSGKALTKLIGCGRRWG